MPDPTSLAAHRLPDSAARRYPHGYALVDVETTGLYAPAHRVLQVAVVHVAADGVIERTWSTLLDPGCDPGPVEVHGLTRRRLAGAPQFPAVVAQLAELLDGRILVAHNALFDWRFLAAEARRALHPLPVRSRLCTVALTRRLDLPVASLSLAAVAEYWGIGQTRWHDAVDDTRVLAGILVHSLAAADRLGLVLPLAGCDPAEVERVYPARAPRPPCPWRCPGRWTPGGRLVQGMKVAITGSTATPREVLTTQATGAGLDVMNTVSGRTGLLVSNEAGHGSVKARDAAKHAVPVVDEEAFVRLLGDVAAGVARAEPASRAEPAPRTREPAPTAVPPGPLAGRCFLVLGGRHEEAAEVRSRIGAFGGIATANLTARVTDIVALAGAERDRRWARVVALGLPVRDPASIEPPAEAATLALAPLARAPGPSEAPSFLVASLLSPDDAGPGAGPEAPAGTDSTVLSRGGVVDLPDGCPDWSIAVTWPARADAAPREVDVVAFLTDEDELVRADADFVFHNAPASADGSVELTLDIPNEALVDLRLGAIPADVHSVILAATLPGGHTFGDVGPVELVVRTDAGAAHIRATLDAATTERSLLLAGVYRRHGRWRFRAIGQGYEYGLAELATNHGVTVDD